MSIKQTVPSASNTTKSLTFEKFKGVDFSSSPFEVSPTRATYSVNLINEDGVNHKRKGWKEDNCSDLMYYYEIKLFGDTYKIKIVKTYDYVNGVLQETPNYHIHLLEKNSTSRTPIASKYIEGANYTGEKSFRMYVRENIAYLIGIGHFLIISRKYVNSTPTIKDFYEHYTDKIYVPTTTISINSDDEESATVASYEDANLINVYRKNTLLGNGKVKLNIVIKKQGSASNLVYYLTELNGATYSDFTIDVKDSNNIHQIYRCDENINLLPGNYSYSISYSGTDEDFKKTATGTLNITQYETINSYEHTLTVEYTSSGSSSSDSGGTGGSGGTVM